MSNAFWAEASNDSREYMVTWLVLVHIEHPITIILHAFIFFVVHFVVAVVAVWHFVFLFAVRELAKQPTASM